MKSVNLTFTKEDILLFNRLDVKELGEVFRWLFNYMIMFENNLNPDAAYLEIQLNKPAQRKLFNKYALAIKKNLLKEPKEYLDVSIEDLFKEYEKLSKDTEEFLKTI